jgi:hypothetical protein
MQQALEKDFDKKARRSAFHSNAFIIQNYIKEVKSFLGDKWRSCNFLRRHQRGNRDGFELVKGRAANFSCPYFSINKNFFAKFLTIAKKLACCS